MTFTIVRKPTGADKTCEQILRELPEWFGIEEAIIGYRKDIEKMPTWVAVDNDRIVGFLTVNYHNKYSAEIQVMGVLKEYHRQGVGRALVVHIEKLLRDQQVLDRYITVLASPGAGAHQPELAECLSQTCRICIWRSSGDSVRRGGNYHIDVISFRKGSSFPVYLDRIVATFLPEPSRSAPDN